jgi:deoxycytidylate deaminase
MASELKAWQDAADAAQAVRLAAETDERLATGLMIAARSAAGDGRVLQWGSLEPLARLLREATLGTALPSTWGHRIIESIPAAHDTCAMTAGTLLSELRSRVPPGAHLTRLRRALASLPDAAATALHLVPLLQGAAAAGDPSLQQEVLQRLDGVSEPPLWMSGLIQAPLLRELGHDWAAAGNSADRAGTALGADGEPDELLPVGDVISAGSNEARLFLDAAALARNGDQRGAKHGCVITDAVGVVLGRGYNHAVREGGCASRGKRRILHAECDAVADAIASLGEEAAFASFGEATAWIVELEGHVSYGDAPPCRKCACLLRAVGLRDVRHSTSNGRLGRLQLPPHRPELLACGMASQPLLYACQSHSTRCLRLEDALVAAQPAVETGPESTARAADQTDGI